MSRHLSVLLTTVALIVTLSPTAQASPVAAQADLHLAVETWIADLSTVDGDGVNVAFAHGGLQLAEPAADPATAPATAPASLRGAGPSGMLVLPPRTLAVPANRVYAEPAVRIPAGTAVDVDVRGLLGSGWTEWLAATAVATRAPTPTAGATATAGAVFAAPVTEVQARITLSAARRASPTVTALRLTADTVQPTQATIAAAAALTYRVFATREGLVGGTTANGHVIVSRDHFVALPSRRGLAPRNTGSFTVRACTTSGSRCEYAPVWDVGPWNTRDDYWNPSSVRENWKDLPQGKPEAQAAYQDGYHGGRDQFGRTVLNPAGIDLADGTFWDGLLLSTNSWVNVSYLWTDSTTSRGRVDVAANGTLNVRGGPGTTFGIVGLAADFANVPIECWTAGQTVTGPFGTTNRWDRIGPGHYVSHAYVAGLSGAPPRC